MTEELDSLRAEVIHLRDSEGELTRRWLRANDRAAEAEAKVKAVEAIVVELKRPLIGARQKANTGDDFAEISTEERIRRECASKVSAAIAFVPAATDPDKLCMHRLTISTCGTCAIAYKEVRFTSDSP